MKKLLFALAAVVLLAASCQNQQTDQQIVKPVAQPKNTPTKQVADAKTSKGSNEHGFTINYPSSVFKLSNLPAGIRLMSNVSVTPPDSKPFVFSIDFNIVKAGILDAVKQTSAYAFSQMFPEGTKSSFATIGGFSRTFTAAGKTGYSYLSYGAREEGVNFLPANIEYFFLPKNTNQTLIIKFRYIGDPGKPPIPEKKQRELFQSVLGSLQFSDKPAAAVTAQQQGERIVSLRLLQSSPVLNGNPGVEITLTSAREFPIRNELVALHIASKKFILSRYAGGGELQTLIFTLTKGEFDSTRTGETVTVQYGEDDQNVWNFGTLDKSLLKN